MSKAERLKWVRETLGLRPSDVYFPLDIKRITFFSREKNLQGVNLLDLASMIEFYNEKWQEKFQSAYPKYHNRTIRRITFEFIVFGVDRGDAENERIIKMLKDNYKEKEEILNKRIMELKVELMKK